MNRSPRISRVQVAVFYSVLAGVALLWGYLRQEPGVVVTGRPLIAPIKALHGPWSPWGEHALLGVLVGLAIAAVTRLMHVYFRWARVLEKEMIKLLGPMGRADVVYLSLVSGIAEELLFRGAIQPQIGYVWASLFFGLVHFTPDKKLWPWTVSAVVMGFVLGGLAVLTGNIIACVMTHVTVNFLNLLHLRKLAPLFGVKG